MIIGISDFQTAQDRVVKDMVEILTRLAAVPDKAIELSAQ